MIHYPKRKLGKRAKYIDEGSQTYGIKKLRLKDLEKGQEKRLPYCQACKGPRSNITVHILTECAYSKAIRERLKIDDDIQQNRQKCGSIEEAIKQLLDNTQEQNKNKLTELVQDWEGARDQDQNTQHTPTT
jgi:hypothetical protein